MIAVDQSGQPALVANSLERGKTLLSAYPLENYLANLPSAFEKEEGTYRIYQAFRDWAGIKPRFSTNQPSVEAASLDAKDHGYVVLVNHSGRQQQVIVNSASLLRSVRRLTPGGGQPIAVHGSQWDLALAPYGAAIMEWR